MDVPATEAMQRPEEVTGRLLRPLFIATIFLGSFLLFLIQPLFARAVLPVLGGSPSVWNTAMLFYQATLLLGYAYAHALQRLPFRVQASAHIAVLALAALTLPIAIADLGGAQTGDAAALWLLKLLALSIGPIFFAVSAQAPLMQAWFARSPDPSAASPYFLYAASNAGSLLGLMAYPFLLEPFTALAAQQALWSAGYLLLLGLAALCAFAVFRSGARPPAVAAASTTAHGARPVTWGRRLHWVMLAAVPSGLMISTTTHITTDVMAMPLLWVIPLGIYLVSFILVFSGRGATITRWAVLVAPAALLLSAMGMLVVDRAVTFYGLASLLTLAVVATALHGTLANDRPPAAKLTEYYLWMSAGGVIGGLFPTLIAPQIFDWVYEHPILLLAAAFLIPTRPLLPWISGLWRGNGIGARALRILSAPITLVISWWLGASFNVIDPPPEQLLALGLLLTLCALAIGRPIIFTWILAMLMLALGGWQQIDISTIEKARQRSFFGIYTIENRNGAMRRNLLHGTTLHGSQSLDPAKSRMPLTYYAPESGVGLAMQAAPQLFGSNARIGVIGLGTGTLSCYATPAEHWTFFEIDPLIVDIARDPAVFSFVSQCKPDAQIRVGDARLELAKQPDASFDLLAVDAFSSDAIPLHLLTVEAFETYRRTLSSQGVLLIHVSNRFMDLEPVVAANASALGMVARLRHYQPSDAEMLLGYNPSIWIALARDEATISRFAETTGQGPAWQPLEGRAEVESWTDGRASVLPVLKPSAFGL